MPARLATSLALLAGILLASCNAGPDGTETGDAGKNSVGLFTSLPIYWGENEDISALIDGAAEPDWTRSTIEHHFTIVPLDALEPEMLEGTGRLIMAQPRPLAPSENVALDNWVRKGGRLLIFADPMLTRHSEFAIGDKRRPQDIVVLSPILARWGLKLLFDEEQAEGERFEKAYDGTFPVNLAGRFELGAPGEGSECMVSETGLLAQCTVGEGRVTLLADAALLDWEGEGDVPPARTGALDSLVAASLDY